MSEVECPTCGRTDFASRRGMKRHHAIKHGESLSKVQVECEYCSQEYKEWEYRKDRTRFCSNDCQEAWEDENVRVEVECEYCSEEYEELKSREDRTRFCSKECRYNWMSENQRKENNPMYKGASEPCHRCGEPVYRPPADLAHNEKVFCSDKCRKEWLSDFHSGENNYFYEGAKETKDCDWCGNEFEYFKSHASRRRFCSKNCLSEWRSQLPPEEQPQWKGGHEEFYGPNWPEQRQKAMERDDFQCQVCGMENHEHKEETGFQLHVHHIQPIRKFREGDDVDYQQANALSNLITLCTTHHAEWEGIPLRPQTTESWSK